MTCIALNTSIFTCSHSPGLIFFVLSIFSALSVDDFPSSLSALVAPFFLIVSENYSDKTVNHVMDLAIMNMNPVFFPLNIIQKECFSASVVLFMFTMTVVFFYNLGLM